MPAFADTATKPRLTPVSLVGIPTIAVLSALVVSSVVGGSDGSSPQGSLASGAQHAPALSVPAAASQSASAVSGASQSLPASAVNPAVPSGGLKLPIAPASSVSAPAASTPGAVALPSAPMTPRTTAPTVAGSVGSATLPRQMAVMSSSGTLRHSAVLSGGTTGVQTGITDSQAAAALNTGQPVPGGSTQGSTVATALPNTNAATYQPPAGNPMSPTYYGLNTYPSSAPAPAGWTPLVGDGYQTLPLSAAPYGYGPGNPMYGYGSAPWIDGNPNDGTRDPITGQVWYPSTQAGPATSPGWKLTGSFTG